MLNLALWGGIAAIVLLAVAAVYSRRGGNTGIQEWMLRVEGLTGLCSDYLALIEQMDEPGHDIDTLRYLDGQRLVTHNQILDALGLDRSYPLDMPAFTRRYLKR
ncbi:hypothetical protein [Chloroflexus sp.]|uniref:hypothetical protein n=1 Tax=Chloroflexus sp. TaxID=1904827 RepID=UPI002ACDBDA0|nr:hypothetical protein [Chloroflexus sp.]